MVPESRPAVTKDQLEIGAAVATVVGLIVAVVALLVAYSEFRDNQRAGRVSATLAYVARYKTEPLLSAARGLDVRTGSAEGQNLRQRCSDRSVCDTLTFIRENGLQDGMMLLIDFFDEVYVCSARNICDLNLVVVLMGPDIQTIYGWGSLFIADTRKGHRYGAQFGCGVEAIYAAEQAWLTALHDRQLSLPTVALQPKACPLLLGQPIPSPRRSRFRPPLSQPPKPAQG